MKLPRTGDKKLDDALEAIEEASEKVNKEWEKRKEKSAPSKRENSIGCLLVRRLSLRT